MPGVVQESMQRFSFWVGGKFVGTPRFTVLKVTSGAAQRGSCLVRRINTPMNLFSGQWVALEAITCTAGAGFLCSFSFHMPSGALPFSSALKDQLIVWGLGPARNGDRISFAPLIHTQLYLLPLVQLFLCLINIGIFFDCQMLKDVFGRVCKAILVCLCISLCARCWIKTHFCFVLLVNFEKKVNT